MIKIDRTRIEKPEYFSSEDIKLASNRLKRFYEEASYRRAQKQYKEENFGFWHLDPVFVLFDGKCAYCESPLKKGKQKNYIDWFRPRDNARNLVASKEITENYDFDHYWWFTYEWENIYLSCSSCLRNKSNWFPVVGERATMNMTYRNTVEEEEYILIDPCNDDVDSHFDYNLETGEIIGNTKRGSVTIDLLQLNRSKLISDRKKAINEEVSFWTLIKDQKNLESNVSRANAHMSKVFSTHEQLGFLGVRRFYIANFFRENKDVFTLLEKKKSIPINIKDRLSLSKAAGKDHAHAIEESEIDKQVKELKRFEIKSIQLFNFRCFERFRIVLPDPIVATDDTNVDSESSSATIEETPWLVFLGENGVGKSSILKAIAIALMGQKYLDKIKLNPQSLLRYGSKQGSIIIQGREKSQRITVRFSARSKKITSNLDESLSYLLGYGAIRLQAGKKFINSILPEKNAFYIKTLNLFDPSVGLNNGTEWLLGVDRVVFEKISQTLKKLLLLTNEDSIQRSVKNKTLTVRYADNRGVVRLEDLSDGYQSIFSLAADLIQTISKDYLIMEHAQGIVLIDEIGTHLHPRWKMEIVRQLRTAFPRIQFIITTHEPLCLRGLKKNEVVVLKNTKEEGIIHIEELPDPSEFRVDQLLTSEFFGLNSTLDFDTERDFNTYYALLAKEKLNDQENKMLRMLRKKLPNKKHLGNSIRDELVYYVIDTLLAEKVRETGFKIITPKLKREAVRRTQELWAELNQQVDL